MKFLPAFIVSLICTSLLASPAFGAGVRVNDEPVPYKVWSISVMPGDTLAFEGIEQGSATLDGKPVKSGWTAPDKAGHHLLEVKPEHGGSAYTISVFVLEPSAKINSSGYLNGYRVGTYPKDTPSGFIRYDEGDYNLPLSPNFTLGQFLCKQQPSHYPKYLVVTPSLLTRLEALLASLNEDGLTEAASFFVMSGFRTPFYNTAIGSAKFSRHMYGDAADVYLDVSPRDGVMDDINSDGKITKADANFMYDHAQSLFASARTCQKVASALTAPMPCTDRSFTSMGAAARHAGGGSGLRRRRSQARA